jgi:poly-beta-1,6-N-acetyl-D-glucosamine synthase
VTLAVVVVFLNEQLHLPRLLRTVAAQTRPTDRLLLVDDGSSDDSPRIARAFADEHAYAQPLNRPRRNQDTDRLAGASELRAFQWAVSELRPQYDLVAKLDADLELTSRLFEQVVAAFERDPRLGIAGAELSVAGPGGTWRRERSAEWHVRGATKFYRRACYEQVSPLPAILGWDTIDEARARMQGWRVAIVSDEPDTRHLRSTGSYDGLLRGFRRRGVAAWGYGAHPLNVLFSALVRMRERPRLLGGLAYLWGWINAAIRGAPRAEPEVLHFVRHEQLQRIRRRILHGAAR